MERLSANTRPSGIGAGALRAWGLILLLAGVVGKGLIQNGMLGLNHMTMDQILQLMNEGEGVMGMVTLSLVLTATESCAVPIFAFLLVEGYQHTASYKKYLTRVVVLATVSEVLYNYVMSGSLVDMQTRNPVWCVVLGLILLGLFGYVDEKMGGKKLLKIVMGVAGILWAHMLKVEYGIFFLAVMLTLWAMRAKPQFRLFVGMGVTALCTAISPFYLAATMGFMVIHFYNGEKSESSSLLNYFAYPAMLLVCALAPLFL